MEPKYPIERVVLAAIDGDVLLAHERARAIVADYIDGLVAADTFARAVLAGLRRQDFLRTVVLDEPPYKGEFDEYLTALSEELITRHGLELVPEWYVKLKLTESDDGATVFCISLHPAERPKPVTKKKGKTK